MKYEEDKRETKKICRAILKRTSGALKIEREREREGEY